MKKKLNPGWIFLFVGVLALALMAHALILAGRGNRPVDDPGWPEGVLAVANLPSRIGWWEGPPFGGGQWSFLYRGDNQAFSLALEKFAAIHASALEIVVRDGPEENNIIKDQQDTNTDTRIDWSFTVWVPEGWNQLYNNPKLTFLAGQHKHPLPVDPPRLEVYIGGTGQLDWTKVTVPNNVHIRDERASAAGVDLSGGSVVRAEIKDIDTGKPIKGARLVLDKMTFSEGTNWHWEKERLVEVTTDSSGLAEINRIQTNHICLSVTADGYAPLRIAQRTLLYPEFLKFTVELARAASVSGIVVDDDHKPMAGVKVRPSVQLNSNGGVYDDGLHYGWFEVSTDDQGRFEFKELPTGHVLLYANAPGFYFTNYQVVYDVPSTQIVLQLRSAGSVSVSVTGKDGKQISKYEGNPLIVNIDPKGAIPIGPGSSMATVSAEGVCEFNDVAPGEYRVSSRPNPGHKSPTYPPDQIITVTAGKRTPVKVIYE